MADIQTISVQNSFVAGELAPTLNGRSDIRQYAQGCRLMRNFIALKHGGVRKRSGTRFVAGCKSDAAASRLVEFQFSDTQGYAIELGNSVMRFFRFDGSGDPGQLESTPGTPTEIATPWPTAALAGIKYAQSADVMILCAEDYAPRRLRRTGTDDTLDASWTLDTFGFEDGPYDDINATSKTLTPSGTTGSITITASASTFAATDVGRWVRIFEGSPGVWGAAQITAYTNATTVTATVLSRLPMGGTSASANWRLGSWHSGTTGGSHWPRCCVWHQGRLWLGGSEAEPDRVWASTVDSYLAFSPSQDDGDVLDSDAISVSCRDAKVNSIAWLVSDRVGQISLTSGGEFVIAPSNDGPVTPSDSPVRKHSARGANSNARPVQIGVSTIFFQTDSKLRELTYSFSTDRIDGPDLAVLSDHLTAPGIVDCCAVETPDSQLWALDADGDLLCVTLEREQQVVAWSKHSVSGEVESIAVVRSGGKDHLWMTVARQVDGGTVRYVEVLQQAFGNDAAQADSWFLDCAIRYEGTAADTITGLDHLEGETVSILADGATHPPLTVSGGEITLGYEAENVLIGLPIESELAMLPPAPQAPFDTRHVLRSLKACHLQLHRSLGGRFRWDEGETAGTAYAIPWRRSTQAMNAAPPLYTGTLELDIFGSPDRDPSLVITHSDPQPFSVLAVGLRMEVGYG